MIFSDQLIEIYAKNPIYNNRVLKKFNSLILVFYQSWKFSALKMKILKKNSKLLLINKMILLFITNPKIPYY